MQEYKLCGIYKIQNKINGKIYIGQTTDFHRRVNEYRTRKASTYKGYNYKIMKTIESEGFDNFTIDFIYECQKEDLDKFEMFYINKYKSFEPEFGYNSFHIDENGKLTINQDTRDKMKISHIGLTETANTKRKKSNKIIALDERYGFLIIADSAKLFGDILGVTKDIIKNKLRLPAMINGYRLYYYDKNKRNEIIEKVKHRNHKYGDMGYLIYGEYLNNASVETIENDFTVINLTYEIFE